MSTTALITAEQFAKMHFADTEDYELVEGELVPLSSGTPIHAEVRDFLGDVLRAYLRRNRIGKVYGEVDCQVSSQTVRRPDISVFLGQHVNFDARVIPVPFAPDIAIEVLSPSEGAIDVNRKALEYLAGGTQEVWIVDGENRELSVRTFSGIRLYVNIDSLESPLLPGFSCPIADLFSTYPAA